MTDSARRVVQGGAGGRWRMSMGMKCLMYTQKLSLFLCLYVNIHLNYSTELPFMLALSHSFFVLIVVVYLLPDVIYPSAGIKNGPVVYLI